MPSPELAISDPAKMQLSFAGCGFLCIYHAGVCAAIKEYAPQLTQNRIKGSSAGAIAAAGLICNVCMSHATSTILQMVTEARAGSLQALSPNFDIFGMVRRGLEESLPQNAHILCSGRLFISATRARDYANVLISDFDSRDELIQAILCSCFIPFYCGRTPPSYRGEHYIDGGFSDNQPGKYEPNTVTVSPFSGESDICPSDEDSASLFDFDFCGTNILFTTQNLFRMVVILFPPSPEVCSRICRQGFEDALRFLTKNNLVPCVKCLTVQSNAIPFPNTMQKVHQNGPRIRDIRRKRAMTHPNSANNLLECACCSEPLDRFEPPRFSGVPLPSVVQKTLADMEARNRASWLTWLRQWRLIRWWLRLVIPPVLLPFEILQFSLRKIRRWLKQTALAPTEAYLHRFQHLVDFILTEVENRRHSSRPGLFPSAILPHGRLSGLRITEISSTTGGEKVMPSPSQINPQRKLSLAQQRKMSTSIAPLDLAIDGLDIGGPKMEEMEEEKNSKVEEEEAKRVLHEFCERHDAVLAFHYRDDQTNELKVCQIFDANGRNPRQMCHTGNLAVPLEYEGHEEEEEEAEAKTESTATEDVAKGEDSGLSLEEEEGNQQPEQRRRESLGNKMREQQKMKDACCSPVRHLATQQQQFYGTRRHTFSSRPQSRLNISASTRTLPSTTTRFVAPGSRLYASNSMNALKSGNNEGKAGAQRKISMQIGRNQKFNRSSKEGSDSDDSEEEQRKSEQRSKMVANRMMGVQRKGSVARK